VSDDYLYKSGGKPLFDPKPVLVEVIEISPRLYDPGVFEKYVRGYDVEGAYHEGWLFQFDVKSLGERECSKRCYVRS
jgi:hypothetical protein